MATRKILHKLAGGNIALKTEIQQTLARTYFKTDMVHAARLNGIAKYKQSYIHLIQTYNKMRPTLVRYELRPYLQQLGYIEIPKTVPNGRTKAYGEEEEEAQQEVVEDKVMIQAEDEEKAPTLDQL